MCSCSARILRHLALGSNPHHKSEALIAVEPLVAAIKVRGLPHCVCMLVALQAVHMHKLGRGRFGELRGALVSAIQQAEQTQ